MADGVLHLQWHNHHSRVVQGFNNLLEDERFVDVTLSCEGGTIKAHRAVLSACSPYFDRLLVENPCPHPIIILRDVKYSELSALLQFMYRGEVNVEDQCLSSFLNVGQSLEIEGLTKGKSSDEKLNTSETSVSAVNCSETPNRQEYCGNENVNPNKRRKNEHQTQNWTPLYQHDAEGSSESLSGPKSKSDNQVTERVQSGLESMSGTVNKKESMGKEEVRTWTPVFQHMAEGHSESISDCSSKGEQHMDLMMPKVEIVEVSAELQREYNNEVCAQSSPDVSTYTDSSSHKGNAPWEMEFTMAASAERMQHIYRAKAGTPMREKILVRTLYTPGFAVMSRTVQRSVHAAHRGDMAECWNFMEQNGLGRRYKKYFLKNVPSKVRQLLMNFSVVEERYVAEFSKLPHDMKEPDVMECLCQFTDKQELLQQCPYLKDILSRIQDIQVSYNV